MPVPTPGGSLSDLTGDRSAEELDLASSLSDLAGLLVDQQPIVDTLRQVAHLTVLAVPGAYASGVTMLENRGPASVAVSSDLAGAADLMQYSLREGPCVTAMDTGRTILVPSLAGETRWPRFAARALQMDVRAVLSLPLLVQGRTRGALNVYARDEHAFGEASLRMGELFAGPAAVAVANAQVFAQSQRLAGQLSDALKSRAVIDQAKGVLMARTGCTPEEAFGLLRELSQSSHRKLHEVAQSVVADAMHRSAPVNGGSA